MTTFLDSIAAAYTDNFEDLSSFCFVFPNKRAGTFFLSSLAKASDKHTILAPEILPVSDFAEILSGLTSASRIDLLFRLFNIYKTTYLNERNEPLGNILDFDSFRGWGEILLTDFSEVDQYLVDPDALFKNLKDFRDISSNFLTSEQIEILEKYFGYTPSQKDIKRFWKHAATGNGESDIKSKFLRLWDMLPTLYRRLTESLIEEGLSTQGGVYRRALSRLKLEGKGILKWDKIVFVGFNALSTSEALIFEELQKLGGIAEREQSALADFFWDATGPVLDSDKTEAALFQRLNKKNFPSPNWAKPYLAASSATSMPDSIESIAAPSNSIQTKIAAAKIEELINRHGNAGITDAKSAVVLPDESLLLPLLHSLPERLEKVNLTMGYPLKQTSVATFLHHMRRLMLRRSRSSAGTAFFREDLAPVIAHPFMHRLFGSQSISELTEMLKKHRRMTIPLDMLTAVVPELEGIIGPDLDKKPTEEIINFFDNMLNGIETKLDENSTGLVKPRIDKANIASYRDALHRLSMATTEHRISLGLAGVFYMIDKIIAGEKVTFEGEPLEGLQVMGLLETRALDFDNLIILSLNDRIMPRKSRRATFIPEALRQGYGLPSSNYQERLFAYYFYRMISRAKSVTLIYDARSGEGMRSGGESRYLLQLRYLFARGILKEKRYSFLLNNSTRQAAPVIKTDRIMERINRFAIEGSMMNFSASALRKYGECPVKFYYEVIAKVKTDPTPTDFIDPITQGNIIHETMLRLYFPAGLRSKYLENRIHVSAETIQRILGNKERIEQEVKRSINHCHFGMPLKDSDLPLNGTALMLAPHLCAQIADILEYDASIAPFDLAGGEMEGLHRWEYETGKFVNMKYAIDRLDILNPGLRGEQWRIVDYKTGNADVSAASIDDIFNGTTECKNLFQLMLYANLMNRDLGMDEDVKLAIYQVDNILKEGETIPDVRMEPEPGGKTKAIGIQGHKSINEEFTSRLNLMIAEIFNPSVPFIPASDESHCRYCTLKQLCGKE